MSLNDKLKSLADEARKLLNVSCKLSLDGMITVLRLKNNNATNQYASGDIAISNGGVYSQLPTHIGLKPGYTYVIFWDSVTTGSDKLVSVRVYDTKTNTWIPGTPWGGIFTFPLGPQFLVVEVPNNLSGQSIWFAKNEDGTDSGDANGVTTFKNIQVYELEGGSSTQPASSASQPTQPAASSATR